MRSLRRRAGVILILGGLAGCSEDRLTSTPTKDIPIPTPPPMIRLENLPETLKKARPKRAPNSGPSSLPPKPPGT